MSVMQRSDDDWADWGSTDEQACFLCGEVLAERPDEPVVMWAGADGSKLWLHGGCSGSFVLRLGRDAWQVERDADDGKYPLTKI